MSPQHLERQEQGCSPGTGRWDRTCAGPSPPLTAHPAPRRPRSCAGGCPELGGSAAAAPAPRTRAAAPEGSEPALEEAPGARQHQRYRPVGKGGSLGAPRAPPPSIPGAQGVSQGQELPLATAAVPSAAVCVCVTVSPRRAQGREIAASRAPAPRPRRESAEHRELAAEK